MFRNIVASVLLAFILLPALYRAQELPIKNANVGFNIGLNLAFGTHFQRAGLNFNFYYVNSFFQTNSEVRVYYSFKNLGPKFRCPELVLSQGIVFGYGTRDTLFNPFINSISNQTGCRNSFSYSYNAYFNTIGTSQQTGLVAFQFNTISVISENDLLARPGLDRYRTGAVLLQYQYADQFQAALNCSMWTGKMGHKIPTSDPHFLSECYMDTTGGKYCKFSHGLLSAQFKYNLGYSQNVQATVGVDAEQVRNALQNHFLHDAPLLPEKLHRGKNCHIPMVDQEGQQFLYKEGQEPRKAKFLLNVYTNASVFY
ncbi:MAG: polymorphic toxin type 23 domain-containing protein [bacterium]|nr:polymorphic toxin type 23 domain-containing protein [bacterium]